MQEGTVTPEQEPRAADVAWCEEHAGLHDVAAAAEINNGGGEAALLHYAEAARYRRILAALTPSPDAECEREMQEAWTHDLEGAVADTIHTLQNEVNAGTAFNEPEWVSGTLELLNRVGPARLPPIDAMPHPGPATSA